MKTIAIIGGGISGLSAGIYAQKAGYQSTIFEKNSICGGFCTGWNRNNNHIDGCIHFLTGTDPNSNMYDLWQTLGALGNDENGNEIKVINPDSFYSVEQNGDTLTLWKDLDRTQKELCDYSPIDSEEICNFIKAVKLCKGLDMPIKKPYDMMNIFDALALMFSMGKSTKILQEYGSIDINELTTRFKNPLIKKLLTCYMDGSYLAHSLLFSYATIAFGNGGIPEGGSKAMAMRIQKKYESLGGTVKTNCPVAKINLTDRKATSITFQDETELSFDYVICATDPDYTFSKLLPKKYMPEYFRHCYEERKKYPVCSSFNVVFAITNQKKPDYNQLYFSCREFTVGTTQTNAISLRNYSYDPSFAKEGSFIIQSSFAQYEDDYDFWRTLYSDRDAYNAEKQRIALEVKEKIIAKFPEYKDNIEIIDIFTPITFNRYTNAYKGSYMSFIITKNATNKIVKGSIKDLDNVFIASQFQMNPGGLPTAAVMGKFAIQRIQKKS